MNSITTKVNKIGFADDTWFSPTRILVIFTTTEASLPSYFDNISRTKKQKKRRWFKKGHVFFFGDLGLKCWKTFVCSHNKVFFKLGVDGNLTNQRKMCRKKENFGVFFFMTLPRLFHRLSILLGETNLKSKKWNFELTTKRQGYFWFPSTGLFLFTLFINLLTFFKSVVVWENKNAQS